MFPSLATKYLIEIVHIEIDHGFVSTISPLIELAHGVIGDMLVMLECDCIVSEDIISRETASVKVDGLELAPAPLKGQVPEEECWTVLRDLKNVDRL